ncbi:MAG: DUF2637 domain-containing protein [Actinocrinis sp.]
MSATLAPPGAPTPIPAANGHPVLDSAMPEPGRRHIDSAVTESGPLGPGWATVTVLIGVMAALIALGGMTLSFRAVRVEMVPAFGAPWAWLVPIVVDLAVFVFSGVDLVLARLDMTHPLARWTVYGATTGTVWLNYSAGGDTAGRVAHVLMPSIWVVFIELMRHVVRRQTNLATGSLREAIPPARWLLSPIPTFLLFRRMVLWRQHSYTAALVMERRRLEAVAVARQIHGHAWRRKAGPLIRLQINLAELDAPAAATALTLATARPLTGQHPAERTAKDRPQHGQGDGQAPATDTAKPRPPRRPSGGQDTASKVAKTTTRYPDWSAARVAEHLGIGERTARRHMTGH